MYVNTYYPSASQAQYHGRHCGMGGNGKQRMLGNENHQGNGEPEECKEGRQNMLEDGNEEKMF